MQLHHESDSKSTWLDLAWLKPWMPFLYLIINIVANIDSLNMPICSCLSSGTKFEIARPKGLVRNLNMEPNSQRPLGLMAKARYVLIHSGSPQPILNTYSTWKFVFSSRSFAGMCTVQYRSRWPPPRITKPAEVSKMQRETAARFDAWPRKSHWITGRQLPSVSLMWDQLAEFRLEVAIPSFRCTRIVDENNLVWSEKNANMWREGLLVEVWKVRH